RPARPSAASPTARLLPARRLAPDARSHPRPTTSGLRQVARRRRRPFPKGVGDGERLDDALRGRRGRVPDAVGSVGDRWVLGPDGAEGGTAPPPGTAQGGGATT